MTKTLAAHRIRDVRKEYLQQELDERSVARAPMRQFERWFEEALEAGIVEPNAMVLATVSVSAKPSARVVLLKDFDARGLVFYTHYTSQKGQEIEVNSRVALVFLWKELERQVRIEGVARRVPRKESERYFAGRPKGSQIGSSISPQSERVPNRTFLERRFEALWSEYANKLVPCPPSWGGYRVIPSRFEFWQGRENRVHDRIEYRLVKRSWRRARLAP